MVGPCGRGSLLGCAGRGAGGTILMEFNVNGGLWDWVTPASLLPPHPEIKFPFSDTSALSSLKLTPLFASVYE